jgi:hypothetical protein
MSAAKPSAKMSPQAKETSMKKQSEHEGAEQQKTSNELGDPGARSGTPARRQLLGTGVYGVGAALFGLAAAACGDDEDDGDSSNGGSSGRGGSSGSGGSAGKGGSAQGGTATNGGTSGRGGATAGAGAGAGGEGGTGVSPDADITPLNALLTAEYNAITAYTAGAGLIDGAPANDPLYPLRAEIIAIAVSIQTQHKLHAQALVEAIEALNGTAVEEADVAAEFEPPAALVLNPSITNVLKFAASAERGAAVAYNQVLAGLEDAQLRFLASSIEGDESQHFIVLTALVLGLADPGENLTVATAGDVFPQAFVSSVAGFDGLDIAPPDYFP